MIIFTGHASNNAKKRWREKFKKKHPEGAKAWARFKRKLRLERRLKPVLQIGLVIKVAKT